MREDIATMLPGAQAAVAREILSLQPERLLKALYELCPRLNVLELRSRCYIHLLYAPLILLENIASYSLCLMSQLL